MSLAAVQKTLGYMLMIEATASRFHLPPHILAGLVVQESGGEPCATRPEPRYKWLFGRRAVNTPLLKRLLPPWRTIEQDFYLQRISFGLCQVMGAVARELGKKGWLAELCKPGVGLHYGGMYLALCRKRRGGDMRAALLLYNGGGDPNYPDKIFKHAKHFEK